MKITNNLIESRSSKFTIIIDENCLDVGRELSKLGFSTKHFDLGVSLSDDEINKILNKMRKGDSKKPLIFITKNYIDFIDYDKKYFVIGIKDLIIADKIARKIDDYIINHKSNYPETGFKVITRSPK